MGEGVCRNVRFLTANMQGSYYGRGVEKTNKLLSRGGLLSGTLE